MNNKPCRQCGSSDRYESGECKPCSRRRTKAYADRIKAADPLGYAKKNKERASRNYLKDRSRRVELNLKRYGLSTDDWNRMFEAQGGSCAMCGKHQRDLEYRLAVDHCHATGKVRALLCPTCNNAVAMYENHGEKVKEYLEIFR